MAYYGTKRFTKLYFGGFCMKDLLIEVCNRNVKNQEAAEKVFKDLGIGYIRENETFLDGKSLRANVTINELERLIESGVIDDSVDIKVRCFSKELD